MNKMENEYIQLPPLKRDTDLRVIMALWEYVRLSDEEREHVLTIMNEIKKIKQAEYFHHLNHFKICHRKKSMILIRSWERLLMILLWRHVIWHVGCIDVNLSKDGLWNRW